MRLLLKWCFSEYKRQWFKSSITLFGLILSLSLFTVTELYIGLLDIQTPAISSQQFTHKIVNTRGIITDSHIHSLKNLNIVDQLSPFNEHVQKFEIDGNTKTIRVIGVDILGVSSILSTSSVPLDFDYSIDLFDLNNVFFFSSNLSEPRILIHFLDTDISINARVIPNSLPLQDVMVMDIAKYQTLFPLHKGIDSLLLSEHRNHFETLQTHLPNFTVMSIQTELSEQSNWTNSLRYNLKFLAMVALLVSTGLMMQFFRFIGIRRIKQADALYKIGVSKPKIAKVIGLEFLLIGVFSYFGALCIGYTIAFLGLTLFIETITTFYLQLTPTGLYISPWLIVKLLIVLIISMGLAYIGILRKMFYKQVSLSKKLIFIALFLSVIVCFVLFQNKLSEWALFASGTLLISSFLWVSILCFMGVSMVLTLFKSPALQFFKMSRTVFDRDILSYGLIAFVIALSLALIICMGIFVESFKGSVSNWLNTVIKHQVYIQNNANDIHMPVGIPKKDILKIQNYFGSTKMYRISRKPLTWQGIPSQLHVVEDDTLDSDLLKSTLDYSSSLPNITVSESFSNRHRLKKGDSIVLEGLISSPLHIAGIFVDYTSEFGIIKMERDSYTAENKALPIHGIAIDLDAEDIEKSINELSNLMSKSIIKIQSGTGLKTQSLMLFNETFQFTWFMVFMIGGIAIICLSNVLTIICLERKAELNQLWMIGFNHSRLRTILFAQLVIICLISLLLSIGLGVALVYFLIFGIQLKTFHWTIQWHFPHSFLTGLFVGFWIIAWFETYLFSYFNKSLLRGDLK